MPKIELSIKASYLPGWGLYESVREIVQNARDAEVQDAAKMSVEHVYRVRNKRPVGTVVVCNEGTTIPKEAFLVGHTTKDGRSDLIGRYGEGFKFGVLAALRLGLDIKIRNGDETWTPMIERSEKFNAEVLKFDISTGHKYENRVQIEILGIEVDQWNEIKQKFLFLSPPIEQSIKTYGGQVLLGPEHKGMIFVKGLFVCSDSSLNFGYDVNQADIDRDRRMINDQRSVTSQLLAYALQSGKLASQVYELLHENAYEVSYLYGSSLGEEARANLIEKFFDQYGADAIAVEDSDEVTELEHFGKKGVRLPYTLRSIIQSKCGSTQEILNKLRMGTKKVYSKSDLDSAEQSNLSDCLCMMRLALIDCMLDETMVNKVSVVDFGDPCLQGVFDPTGVTIQIARSVLKTRASTLRVLVHEAAHVVGRDGTKAHEAMIGNLTQSLFNQLLK